MLADPAWPRLSRTVTMSGRVPLSAAVVTQRSETGPELGVLVVETVVPLAISEYVLEPAAALSIQTVSHTVPRTVSGDMDVDDRRRQRHATLDGHRPRTPATRAPVARS